MRWEVGALRAVGFETLVGSVLAEGGQFVWLTLDLGTVQLPNLPSRFPGKTYDPCEAPERVRADSRAVAWFCQGYVLPSSNMPGTDNESQLSSSLDQILTRLERLEAHARLVAKTVGVPFGDPTPTVPPEVIELARAGDKRQAVKRYRELTGVSLDEASGIVAGL